MINDSKYSQIAVYTNSIDTDAALMSLQPKLKAAGDRTFDPIFHKNRTKFPVASE
ncbi:hypothetical protein [Microcoleus sp. BROC3]|uniref:hypothetical protein n=1 Tax=Microcoleus sp. BROC3 TaxID=3055323 RepID=UPI002FD4C2BD